MIGRGLGLVGRLLMVLLGLAVVLFVGLAIAWPFTNHLRNKRVAQVCDVGDRLAEQHQFQAALAAYERAERARTTNHCGRSGVEKVNERLAARDRQIEFARLARAAADASGHAGDTQLDVAIQSYLLALTIDPSSSGARRALRAALREHRARHGPDVSCALATELVGIGLLDEARVLFAPAFGARAAKSCVEGRDKLVQRRATARAELREARIYSRAGEVAAAKTHYLEALRNDSSQVDASLAPALAGLRSDGVPTIPRSGRFIPTGWGTLAVAGAAIAGAAAVLALLALLAALLLWVGWKALAWLIRHTPPLRRRLRQRRWLRRLTQEHVRLAPIAPLDRDGEVAIARIREEIELGRTALGAPPPDWQLVPDDPLDQPAGQDPGAPSLVVSALGVVPALAPVAAGLALASRLTPRWESTVALRPRSNGAEREVWWTVVGHTPPVGLPDKGHVVEGGAPSQATLDDLAVRVAIGVLAVYS